MKHKNCLVAQSGGPTAAINASLAGIIAGVSSSGCYEVCYGAVNGILGILNENYLNLTGTIAQAGCMDRLISTPAMYLGSCRHRLPDYRVDAAPYRQIFGQLERLDIGAFFYIGGNDSMDTVLKLSQYAAETGSDIRILGVPKTIDNDLCNTDHTPGFGSAAKYIAGTMLEVAHDTFIYPVKSVTIVEIMGRDAGWLTAASALARNSYNRAPHLLYLPEVPFDSARFLEDIRESFATDNNVIVAVSEGVRDIAGNYIAASAAADQFGHRQLSGAGKMLEYLVAENLGVKVRSVEINVLQRCAAHMASAVDLKESFSLGEYAVTLARQGITASMATIQRLSDSPYTTGFSHAPITGIANEAKTIPREWINEAGNDVTPELLSYLRPLIQGETAVEYEDGIPRYMPVPHLKPKS
ncbi:MAG: 6-phosphofructokinase [Blautia sp.]|nr:6-phosphofructokinase [Blautia sp.]